MATPDPDRPGPWRAAAGFAAITAIVVAALGIFAGLNRDRIARNEQAWLTTRLEMLLAGVEYDNDPLTDRIEVTAPDDLGTPAPVPVFRARRGDTPVAAVLLPVAPDGYGGPLRLMVAITYENVILGVQVLEHRETPGLGDAFATPGSTWLAAFAGRSPPSDDRVRWTIRRDGGDFDQFTGASITPRAIIRAVQRTLDYHGKQRGQIYRDTGIDRQE